VEVDVITVDVWAADLLVALGAPNASVSRRFLSAWALGESTKADFNPLATTESAFGGLHAQHGESEFNNLGTGFGVKTSRATSWASKRPRTRSRTAITHASSRC